MLFEDPEDDDPLGEGEGERSALTRGGMLVVHPWVMRARVIMKMIEFRCFIFPLFLLFYPYLNWTVNFCLSEGYSNILN